MRRSRRKRPTRQKRKFYYTNYRIPANELRVIDSKGEQVGVLKKEEALRLAREQEIDLVLIARKANPPVAKLIDFKKFLYQEKKKQKLASKGIKKSVVKDVKISLFIDEGDYRRLADRGMEFLKEGNQLRINLKLKGREVIKKPMAYDLIHRFIKDLGDVNLSKDPKFKGRTLVAVVSRKKS